MSSKSRPAVASARDHFVGLVDHVTETAAEVCDAFEAATIAPLAVSDEGDAPEDDEAELGGS